MSAWVKSLGPKRPWHPLPPPPPPVPFREEITTPNPWEVVSIPILTKAGRIQCTNVFLKNFFNGVSVCLQVRSLKLLLMWPTYAQMLQAPARPPARNPTSHLLKPPWSIKSTWVLRKYSLHGLLWSLVKKRSEMCFRYSLSSSPDHSRILSTG